MSKCKIDEIEIVISVELIGVQSIENMRHKNIDLKSESISGEFAILTARSENKINGVGSCFQNFSKYLFILPDFIVIIYHCNNQLIQDP